MVVVAQLVRVAVCGAAGRRFEPGQPPKKVKVSIYRDFFCFKYFIIFISRRLYQPVIFFHDWQFPMQ